MEFFPLVPKPKRPTSPLLLPLYYFAMTLTKLPSSMLAVVSALFLENCVVRPMGFRTETIGDLNRFTPEDALPRPFFFNLNDYDTSEIRVEHISTIMGQAVLLCLVGTIESLMTAEVVSSFTRTSHDGGMVIAAMGLGNIVSGFLGGMGGNAMIGLSTIACLNGGRYRIGPVVTAICLFLCVAIAYPILNYIPMAALVGVMMVVVLHTFKWSFVPIVAATLMPKQARELAPADWSLKRKVARMDVAITVIVTVLTVLTNLVYGVLTGLAVACARFAWSAGKLTIRATTDDEKELKTYEVEGPLFFASAKEFVDTFDAPTDPKNVEVLFSEGELFDYTAVDALTNVARQYSAAGKNIVFRQLTARSVSTLEKAAHLVQEVVYSGVQEIDINKEEDDMIMRGMAG